MGLLTLKEIINLVQDPNGDLRLLPHALDIRRRFIPGACLNEPAPTRAVALTRSIRALRIILPRLLEGIDGHGAEAGHGPGHWCRDYVNALQLSHDPTVEPGLVLPCLLGGTLHDIGTVFVGRYEERTRAVRHAEIGALAFRAVAQDAGLTETEADTVAYAIAAHTHYLKATEMRLPDGSTHTIEPYADTDADGRPLLEVWLARWVDRLDCCGATMMGRHALVTVHDMHDYSSSHGFYAVRFAEHMRALLRSPQAIAAEGGRQTMAEHMRMFADSQTGNSPYGRHDRGRMVRLRDKQRAASYRILDSLGRPLDTKDPQTTAPVTEAWQHFLATNIEPSPQGRAAAGEFNEKFANLDEASREAWLSAFRTIFVEYKAWATETLAFLEQLPDAEAYLGPGLFPFDVLTLIRPNPSWTTLLTK